ncbi:MAG: hypothetical protein QOI41_5673 [Myxococcales bacterium]|nr:hypothetical protein [Myxococcales bacterium]
MNVRVDPDAALSYTGSAMSPTQLRSILRSVLAASSLGACGGFVGSVEPPTDQADTDASVETGMDESAPGDIAVASDATAADVEPDHQCVTVNDSAPPSAADIGLHCKTVTYVSCNYNVEACDAAICPRDSTTAPACVADAGDIQCVYCAAGRRPPGFVPTAAFDVAPLGSFFAHLAELEAASVDAFEILGGELAAHRAPPALVDRVHRAAADERRHARVTNALAKRHGGSAAVPVVLREATRDLEAMAIENATEGCVRETFGALAAMYQAEHAEDREIGDVMRRIAGDEIRHAALAWELASWFSSKLDAGARERVAQARAEAVAVLTKETSHELHADVVRFAGIPRASEAGRLVGGLRAAMWS